jgi:diacylglycerol kinase family enzyme
VRAVALLGPYARPQHLKRFELPGVNLFSGNDLDATDQPEAALIFGGDGTVHRHLGGLALKQIAALVVPIGSANDFAQSIGIRNMADAESAWQRFCGAGNNIRNIDLGTIRPIQESADQHEAQDPWTGQQLEDLHFVPDGPRRDLPQMGGRIMQSQLRRQTDAQREVERETLYCCIAGTGLDAVINRKTLKQSHWVHGHGGYVLALLQTLGSFRPPRITISAPEQGSWRTVIDEPGFLIAAGNGPQYGHGMRLTHRARMDDGLLDVCFVGTLSKLRLLRLFRVVYRGGHIGMDEVEYFQAERLRITTVPVMEVFADGEYICPTPVEISVKRDALRAIIPA